jgi:hypothetical protein
MRATREKAITQGWGLPLEEAKGLTRKQIIAAAIEKDFERMRGWCNDGWCYIGVVVTVDNGEGKQASLWGIESDCPNYIEEVKKELAEELLPYTQFERSMRKASQTV